MISPCPKCGTAPTAQELPKYVKYHGLVPGWPKTASGGPQGEALAYPCSVCGFLRFTPTVANGGAPYVPPAPPKPAKKDD